MDERLFGSRSRGPYVPFDPVPTSLVYGNTLYRDEEEEIVGDEDEPHASRKAGTHLGGRNSVPNERIRKGSEILAEQARERRNQSPSERNPSTRRRIDPPEIRTMEVRKPFRNPDEEKVSLPEREWKPVYEGEVKRRYNERKRNDTRYKQDLMEDIEKGVIGRGGKRGSLYHEYIIEGSVIRDKAIDIVNEITESIAVSSSSFLSPSNISYPFSIPSNVYDRSEIKELLDFIEKDLKAMRRG